MPLTSFFSYSRAMLPTLPKTNLSFGVIFSSLQMLSIWTSLYFSSFVRSSSYTGCVMGQSITTSARFLTSWLLTALVQYVIKKEQYLHKATASFASVFTIMLKTYILFE